MPTVFLAAPVQDIGIGRNHDYLLLYLRSKYPSFARLMSSGRYFHQEMGFLIGGSESITLSISFKSPSLCFGLFWLCCPCNRFVMFRNPLPHLALIE